MLEKMRIAWFGLFLSAELALAAAPGAGAEPPKPAPAGEVVRGELVAKSETSLDVQQEDEPQVSHCPLFPAGFTVKLDAKYQAFLRDLAIGSEVQLLLANEPTGRRVTNITVLAAPGKWGKLAGPVVAVGPGRLELQDGDGKKRVFAAPFTATGPDKEMTAAIAQRTVGDRVEIHWTTDDHVRVRTIRVLELSAQAVAKAGFEGGTVVGQVVEKDKDSVTIKGDDGRQERYLPQRIVGVKDGLDKDVLKAIGAAKVGDRLEGRWFRDGERRLYALKPAAPAAAPAPGADKK
jgi:hypothetical protein